MNFTRRKRKYGANPEADNFGIRRTEQSHRFSIGIELLQQADRLYELERVGLSEKPVFDVASN
jgi:hypothetical protein